MYLGSIHVVNAQRGLGWAAIEKIGPNNVSCVIWAIGMSFFLFLHILLILAIFFGVFRFYSCYN